MSEPADPRHSRRKIRDRSMVLLLIGTVMLMPPFASIFALDGRIAGIPILMLYVLAVWGALIAGTAVLARRLREGDTAAEIDAENREGGG